MNFTPVNAIPKALWQRGRIFSVNLITQADKGNRDLAHAPEDLPSSQVVNSLRFSIALKERCAISVKKVSFTG
jgi:hypothetical protein